MLSLLVGSVVLSTVASSATHRHATRIARCHTGAHGALALGHVQKGINSDTV